MLDGRGNRVLMQEVEPGSSGGETIDADDDRIQYLKGTWATEGAYEASDDFSARFRLNFWGDQAVITLGNDTDGGIVDIYADQNYWGSIDTYAASAADETVTINFYKDTFHKLEVRNRSDKHPSSSGRKLRLKQIQVSTDLALQTIQYTYDALARLQAADYYEGDDLSATPTRQYAYNYDPAGNRTQQVVTVSGSPSTTNYTYNAANQLTGDGVLTYTYDANGNLTSDGTNTRTWDRANRLLSFGGSSYAYNGLGQRISQTISSVVTEYLLDVQPGLWKVIAATASGNTDRFIHDPMGIAQHEDNSGNWHWMAKDGLGTVRGVYDDTLTEVYAADRDPYGDLIASTGTNPTPFEYTGEPEDQNGLLHLRARYYEPSLAVFNSLDPVETANRYAYVGGNPVNLTDSTGNGPTCQADTCPSGGMHSFTYNRSNAAMAAVSLASFVETNKAYPSFVDSSLSALGGHSAEFMSLSLYAGGFLMSTSGPTPETRNNDNRKGWRASLNSSQQVIGTQVWNVHNTRDNLKPRNDENLIGYLAGTPGSGGDHVMFDEAAVRSVVTVDSIFNGDSSLNVDILAGYLSNSFVRQGDYVLIDSVDEEHGLLVVGWGPAVDCDTTDLDMAQLSGGTINVPDTTDNRLASFSVPYVADWSTARGGAVQRQGPRPFYCTANPATDGGFFGHNLWVFIRVPSSGRVPCEYYFSPEDAGFTISTMGTIE